MTSRKELPKGYFTFIGNVPHDATEQEIADFFCARGVELSIGAIDIKRSSDQVRCCALVSFNPDVFVELLSAHIGTDNKLRGRELRIVRHRNETGS